MPDARLTSPQRLSALYRTGLLDTAPEPEFDRVTDLVRRLLGVDVALVSLIDADRQFFKSGPGLPEPVATARQTPLSHSLCQHVVRSGQPLALQDARADALTSANGAVVDLGVVNYLGHPIRAPDGQVIGSLCGLGFAPREWTANDLATMRDLAGIVENEIALRDRARRADELAERNALLAREYHHRVKNAFSVASALIGLSAREATTVEALVKTARSRLTALASAQDAIDLATDEVDLGVLVERLVRPHDPTGANVAANGPPVLLAVNQVTPVCLLLHELSVNSAKYGAFGSGLDVSIMWSIADDGGVTLVWRETSPSIEAPTHRGFGSRLIELAASQLGGTAEVSRGADELRVTLRYPRAIGAIESYDGVRASPDRTTTAASGTRHDGIDSVASTSSQTASTTG